MAQRNQRQARRRAPAVLLSLGLLLAAGACGGDDDEGAAVLKGDGGRSSTPSAISVTTEFTYTPADLKVKAGQEVAVTNTDTQAHTLTADSAGAFDVTLPPGQGGSITAPAEPGTYAYHCSYHPIMKAQLVVE